MCFHRPLCVLPAQIWVFNASAFLSNFHYFLTISHSHPISLKTSKKLPQPLTTLSTHLLAHKPMYLLCLLRFVEMMTLVFRASPFPYKLDLTLSCLLDDTALANSPLFYISFSFTQSFLSYLLGNSVSPTLHSMHISQLPLVSLLASTARFLFVSTHCLQPPFSFLS